MEPDIGVGAVEVVSVGEERRGEERRGEEREERFVFRACLRTDRSLFCFEDNCEDHTRHETEIENEQTTGQEVKNT